MSKQVSKVKKMGRPPKPIDLVAIESMASKGCSIDEIAVTLGEPPSTLASRNDFTYAFKKGQMAAKLSLRSKMFAMAMDGNTAMAIFLAKNFLGMRDKPEDSNNDDNVEVSGFEFVTEDEASKLEKARLRDKKANNED